MIAARPEFSRARPGQPGRVYAVCRRRKELFAALHNQITEGAILKPLLSFFFPILLGTFFQQLYNTVDAIIVGNFVGTAALGAVGGPTAVLINFLVNLFVGLSSGATVVIAQYYGARQGEDLREAVHTGIALSLAAGVVITGVGIALSGPVLRMMGTPEDVMGYALTYLRVYFCGTMASFIYNMGSSILRAIGDTKRPLYFLIAACLTNIVLDALFVAVLQWGAEGAALATILSQFVGGAIPLVYFLRPNSSKLRLGRTAFHGRALLKACANGSSEFMTNISMSVVNMLYNWQLMRLMGSGGVAVYGVIMYVNFIFIAIFLGYSMGSAPIVGYHYGAGNRTELRGLLRKSLCIITVMSVVLTAAALLLARPLSMIFMSKEATLLPVTIRAFSIYSLSFLMAGYNIYASSFFTALNDGFISALISFARTLVFQVAAVTVLPVLWDIDGVWAAVVAAETLALLLSAACLVGKRKKYGYA